MIMTERHKNPVFLHNSKNHQKVHHCRLLVSWPWRLIDTKQLQRLFAAFKRSQYGSGKVGFRIMGKTADLTPSSEGSQKEAGGSQYDVWTYMKQTIDIHELSLDIVIFFLGAHLYAVYCFSTVMKLRLPLMIAHFRTQFRGILSSWHVEHPQERSPLLVRESPRTKNGSVSTLDRYELDIRRGWPYSGGHDPLLGFFLGRKSKENELYNV